MSENYPGMEYESRPMSDVMKYYYSLDEDDITERNGFISVVNLIDSLPIAHQPELTGLLVEGAFPDDWLYDADQIMAVEKLALLPLMYISPHLEKSDYPISDVKGWNDDVITGLNMVSRSEHGQKCLAVDADCTYDQCQKSFVCPRRVMKRFLKQDLPFPNFKDSSYIQDPKRAYRITMDKLDIGVAHGIMRPGAADNLRRTYDLQFHAWLNSRWPTSQDL